MTFFPRPWQSKCQQAEDRFWQENYSNVFFLEACPAAGKSTKAAMTAKAWLDSDACQCVIVVAPWKSILGSLEHQASELGMLTSRSMFAGTGYQHPPADDVLVLTYSRLCKHSGVTALQEWTKRHGFRFGLIVDEIHHSSVSQRWGYRLAEIGAMATRTMIMSGTPFRTDNNLIQFVKYHNGSATPDFQLTYSQAVSEGYVRNVTCRYVSSDYLYTLNSSGEVRQKRMEELNSAEVASLAPRIFDADSNEMRQVIALTHQDMTRLREDRNYSDAAALFVCRPGRDIEERERHVLHAARVVEEVTGVQPVVVTHTDADAEGKLNRFRKSDAPYIVAVNMVSEGCDIPRIQAVAFLRLIQSEMLFRQIVGRSLRRRGSWDNHPATIYLTKINPMAEWAEVLYEEASTAIANRKCCLVCNTVPCQCPRPECESCGFEHCMCPRCEECGRKAWMCACGRDATHTLVSGELMDGGGYFAFDGVEPRFIEQANEIVWNYPSFRSFNTVFLGAVLKAGSKRADSNEHSLEQDRCHIRDRVVRLVTQIAARRFGGQTASVFQMAGSTRMDLSSIEECGSLPIDQLKQLERWLTNELELINDDNETS